MPFGDKMIFFNSAKKIQNLHFGAFLTISGHFSQKKVFPRKKNLSHTSPYEPLTPDKVQKKLITQLKQNSQKEEETDSRTEKRKSGRWVQKCEKTSQ